MTRRRLDLELIDRGLAATRGEARDAIEAGRVTVGGRPATKPATLVAADEAVVVDGPPRPFASRGGEKLAGGLDALGVDPAGRRALDLGASTGGFTDVLLARGAEHVVAVDVGYGQLAWRLRSDPRVTVLERTNARELSVGSLPYAPDVVTADLSFISLTKVVPAIAAVAAPDADGILLVKPQFEAGREDVGRGVVTDPVVWRRALESVAGACAAHGLAPVGATPSPLQGPAGNVELFLHVRRGAIPEAIDVEAVVAAAGRVRGRAS